MKSGSPVTSPWSIRTRSRLPIPRGPFWPAARIFLAVRDGQQVGCCALLADSGSLRWPKWPYGILAGGRHQAHCPEGDTETLRPGAVLHASQFRVTGPHATFFSSNVHRIVQSHRPRRLRRQPGPPRQKIAQTAVWSDEASFARRKAMQPGTCATLSPWSRSGPLKSYLRNKARYRS